jgi:hypothetical protein
MTLYPIKAVAIVERGPDVALDFAYSTFGAQRRE